MNSNLDIKLVALADLFLEIHQQNCKETLESIPRNHNQ
jgi:hypothetical protein